MLLGVRSLNTNPKFRAADTNASSSGDWAWYSSLPVKEGKTEVQESNLKQAFIRKKIPRKKHDPLV